MVYYDEITSVRVLQRDSEVYAKPVKALPVKNWKCGIHLLLLVSKTITFKTKLKSGTYLNKPEGMWFDMEIYG